MLDLDLFYKGGPLMYPLLLGSVLMVAVIIERGFKFINTGVKNSFIENIKKHVQQNDFERAIKISNKTKAAIIYETLNMRRYTIDVIENEVSIRGDLELRNLRKNLHLLELIGKIAPMIGLLGTVMGMVKAFQEVALLKNIVDPSILANGIWEALITTVAGLFVGIPALVFHHLYENRIKSIAFSMKHHADEIISMIRRDHDRV